MQLSKAIEGYVFSALAEGYSSLTLNAYRSSLLTLAEYLGDNEIQDVSVDNLISFMNYLVTDYKPVRVNNPENTSPLSPASPWENGYIESFNGKLRDELLNREIFYTLQEAKILIEHWRMEYNQVRPHSALGYKPPAPRAVISPPVSASLLLSSSQTLT